MHFLSTHIGWGGLALMIVVTLHAVGIAYLQSPRAKALMYVLPFPFTTALIVSGRGVDATHIAGLLSAWGMLWLVWFLHSRLRLHILLTIVLGVAFQCGCAAVLLRLIPTDASVSLFLTLAVLMAVTSLMALWLPLRDEPGHRSRLPVYIKMPVIFLIVGCLVMLKEPLRGFMPTFPYTAVLAIYESRKSLHNLALRSAILWIGLAAYCMAVYLLLPSGTGIPPASFLLPVSVGWLLYLPIWWLCDRLWLHLHSRR